MPRHQHRDNRGPVAVLTAAGRGRARFIWRTIGIDCGHGGLDFGVWCNGRRHFAFAPNVGSVGEAGIEDGLLGVQRGRRGVIDDTTLKALCHQEAQLISIIVLSPFRDIAQGITINLVDHRILTMPCHAMPMKLTSKGEVTIPKQIRDALNLAPC